MDQLALFSHGHPPPHAPVLNIGDWIRTRDGRLVEITKWPSISQADAWGIQELRQTDGTVWRVTP